MAQFSVGVDVGGTKTAYGLFAEGQQLVGTYEQPTLVTGTCQEIAEAIADGLHALLRAHDLIPDALRGIGLALPSYIDFDTGYILCTTNITPLRAFNAREFFEERFHVPVYLDNDANVAALAEHRLGAGRGRRHMLYCAVSTGISNGIIINRELFRGSYGAAGESGHMLMTPDSGVLCGCGNRGCFMSWTSGSMIVQHIRNWLSEGRASLLTALCGGAYAKIDCRMLVEAVNAGDAMAREAVEQMAYHLGVWTYNLYQVFNIDCYVFGGGLVNMGGLLFDAARAHFDRFNVYQKENRVDFLFAELGHHAGIIGAALLLPEA